MAFLKSGNAYTLMKTTRKYYKYTSWTQPVLTANGTLGGSSFAVATSSCYSTYEPYFAFDSDQTTTRWSMLPGDTSGSLYIYNPVSLKITSIVVTNREKDDRAFASGVVYGSNDNSSYTQITTFSNSDYTALANWTINMSGNTGFYKYYKIVFYPQTQDNACGTCNIALTAVSSTTEEGTSTDYDFYVDTVTRYTLVKGSYITY